MKTNYVIDNTNKKVIAKVGNLTKNQIKKISNYIALGYELVEYVKPTESKWTKESIVNFLKTQDKKYLEEYEKICNEPVLDANNQPKKYKNGNVKTKGHIAALRWFKATFKNY